MLLSLYKTLINNAKIVFSATLFVCVVLSFFATQLRVDASAETLLLDDDKDLEFFRQVNKDYKSDDFLILAIKPKDNDPFSTQSLTLLKALQSELENTQGVQGILSILNAPLLKSSDNSSLQDLLKSIPTLTSPETNITKARAEIANSPFFQNNIISKDANSTAFIIYLDNQLYENLIENAEQNATSAQISAYQDRLKKENKERLQRIKAIIAQFAPQTNGLYLGGVSMIADDMITYIKDDLLVYGISLTLLLSLVLWFFFRQISLVFFTLFVCISSLGAASGIFALLGFKITVISSNYLALMLIITISLIIHLITYFINLCKQFPKANIYYKVLATLLAKSRPSFYAILTTAIGFLSLVLSKIEPVIKLGIMMSIGISVSLLLSFLFFASIVPHFKRLQFKSKTTFKVELLNFCANLSLKYPKIIYAVSALCIVVSLFGIDRLQVENSFVNYFKDSSEIKRGLVVIDEYFGGTLPLELVVTFLEDNNESNNTASDSFESEFEALSHEKTYWFKAQKTRVAQNLHEYLQNKEFVGSVLSLNSLLLLAQDINDGKELDDFALAFLNENLPDEFKENLLNAYVNIDKNQLRFVMRIKDSNPHLKRAEFIKEIQHDTSTLMKDEHIQIQLSGLMLLYNNMLQSLFDSQFNTLVFVIMTIFLLFIFVFKSVRFALVGIIANVVPLSLVFALMGFAGLPLDLMSITIAAICIGLGVDDSIHYIYNFKKLAPHKGTIKAIKLSHFQIGQAFFQSKVAIILGFSVMMSSNFTPTIYFGFLTLLVMVLLLLGSLLLLPSLLAFKFTRE